MDLYAERQCVDAMITGDTGKFLLLFEDNFEEVYEYVARRVDNTEEVERIIRLAFLDGLGQIQNTPSDVSYLVWLFSLGRPRVADYLAKQSMPSARGLISKTDNEEVLGDYEKFEKVLSKLSLEEREILRLKFFEQVTDGDVMTILGFEEGVVGTKIYRVLKRAHFLLFGEADDQQGIYFGELSSFFERVREAEFVEVPEAFRLSLRADLSSRIERKGFAVEAEVVEEEKAPVKEKVVKEQVGSDDPAKVFVDAVKEMRSEGVDPNEFFMEAMEMKQAAAEMFDKWKIALIAIPALIFIAVIGFVAYRLSGFGGVDDSKLVERGYPTNCNFEVDYKEGIADGIRRSLDAEVANKICDYFAPKGLVVMSVVEGSVSVNVDLESSLIKYQFVRDTRLQIWRIIKYAKTANSNEQSREV